MQNEYHDLMTNKREESIGASASNATTNMTGEVRTNEREESIGTGVTVPESIDLSDLDYASWCRKQRDVMKKVRAQEEEEAVLKRKMRKMEKLNYYNIQPHY